MTSKNGLHFRDIRTWGPKPKYDRVRKFEKVDNDFIKIAGPCSVENKHQIWKMAKIVSELGANYLRGGVFRAGTYPGNNFGWVEEELIAHYHEAAEAFGLRNIIEVLDYTEDSLELISKYCSCYQIGARSMQNYTLLKRIARSGKRIFLKRGTNATLDELLGSCEHLLINGAKDIVIIERGGVTNLNHVRWDLSISMIPAVKALTQIPIIVDASHGTGRRDLVEPMILAGIAAGADGLLCEVHENPDYSFSDAEQAIEPIAYKNLMDKVNKIKSII